MNILEQCQMKPEHKICLTLKVKKKEINTILIFFSGSIMEFTEYTNIMEKQKKTDLEKPMNILELRKTEQKIYLTLKVK